MASPPRVEIGAADPDANSAACLVATRITAGSHTSPLVWCDRNENVVRVDADVVPISVAASSIASSTVGTIWA